MQYKKLKDNWLIILFWLVVAGGLVSEVFTW